MSSDAVGGGLGGFYRLLFVGFVLAAFGFVCVGLTAGVGEPGVVVQVGLVLLGAGFGAVGSGIVRYREPVAATDSKYDYGEAGTAFFGVVFLAAGVALALAALAV
jgi:uncharacterized membrane protein YidH (DUF202 family)